MTPAEQGILGPKTLTKRHARELDGLAVAAMMDAELWAPGCALKGIQCPSFLA
jgi:hypothetical protein